LPPSCWDSMTFCNTTNYLKDLTLLWKSLTMPPFLWDLSNTFLPAATELSASYALGSLQDINTCNVYCSEIAHQETNCLPEA